MVTREATVPPPFRYLPEIHSISTASVFGLQINTVLSLISSDVTLHEAKTVGSTWQENKIFPNNHRSKPRPLSQYSPTSALDPKPPLLYTPQGRGPPTEKQPLLILRVHENTAYRYTSTHQCVRKGACVCVSEGVRPQICEKCRMSGRRGNEMNSFYSASAVSCSGIYADIN